MPAPPRLQNAQEVPQFPRCKQYQLSAVVLDADDVYHGTAIEYLFSDGRLRIQPLCYDVSTNQMVPPPVFTEPSANASNWIFYFNNNPLIASHGHAIVERALAKATEILERLAVGELPEIQSTTRPWQPHEIDLRPCNGARRY